MRAAETPLPVRTLELTSAPTILLKGSHVSGKAPKLSVCQCVYVVLKSPEAFHPPDLFAHALSGTSAFSLRLMSLRLPVRATRALKGAGASDVSCRS